MADSLFRKVCEADIPEVGEIFNFYVLNSTASFYFKPLDMDEIRNMVFFESERHGAFVAEEDGVIKGFCYISPFNKREGYDGAVEITLYLKDGFTGMGIGSKAVEFLEGFSRQKGFRTLISVICGENQASIKLFEKMGYEKCAHLKDIGKKFGRLLDVLYYQKML